MTFRALAVLGLSLAFTATLAGATSRLAPLPSAVAVSSHGPYEAGACDTCHQRSDARRPGGLRGSADNLCLDCHDEFGSGGVTGHPATGRVCTQCHNPHNATRRGLLL